MNNITTEQTLERLNALKSRWENNSDTSSNSINIVVDDDFMNAVYGAISALDTVQKIPDVIRILKNLKDPEPQNSYGRQKNEHYDNAIGLLEDLIEPKDKNKKAG